MLPVEDITNEDLFKREGEENGTRHKTLTMTLFPTFRKLSPTVLSVRGTVSDFLSLIFSVVSLSRFTDWKGNCKNC